MGKIQGKPGAIFVGLYAWLAAMFVGAIVVDITYSRLFLKETAAFSEVADFLLMIGFLTFLTGLIAIAFSWKLKFARVLLIASLLALTLELVVPLFFSRLLAPGQIDDLGPWLRIIPVGSGSILAFFGLYNYFFYKY